MKTFHSLACFRGGRASSPSRIRQAGCLSCLSLMTCLAWLAVTCLAADPARPESAETPREEPLAIIIHKSNPMENIAVDELRKLCLADRRHWSNGRKVTLALLEPGRPEREAVLRQICQMSETEFTHHFLEGAFVGQVQAAPKELATPTGIRRFVFNVPGAIGFIPARDVDDSVKILRLEGRAPSDPGYALKVSKKTSPDTP